MIHFTQEQTLELNQPKMESSASYKEAVLGLLESSLFYEQENDLKNALDAVNMAWHYCQTMPFERTKECEEICLSLLLRLTQLNLKVQDYKKLEEYAEYLLSYCRNIGDVEREVSALTHLAIVRSVDSDYKAAMPYFVEALEKSQNLGLSHSAVNCLINIGNIYANLFNYDEALERYGRVLSDYPKVLSEETEMTINLNTGNLYYASEQFILSLDFLQRALRLAHRMNRNNWVASIYALKSRTLLALNRIEDAVDDANMAAKLMRNLSVGTLGRQINLLNLAQIDFLTGDTEGGIQRALRGIAMARRVNDDISEVRGFQLLSTIYKNQKQYKKALSCQTIYAQKQADYLKMQRNMHALDLEIRYTLKEKQSKIEELTNITRFQGELLEHKSQIEKQNEQLKQANEELQQFAYISSHDLKEPLRMIGSFSQIIQRQIDGKIDDETRDYFRYVNEGIYRMNGLLDALLQYATIGKVAVEFEPVDAADVVNIARANLKLVIDETNANILCGELPVVNAVSSLLVQLFQNLLNNAIKFRRADSRPIILINAEEKSKEWVFAVQDNGIGISEEHRERVFVIFQRLHARAKYPGTGIGLSICHKIIAQLGGKIWVESSPEQGSSFFFTIPK